MSDRIPKIIRISRLIQILRGCCAPLQACATVADISGRVHAKSHVQSMPLFYSVNFPSLSQAKGQMAELQAQVCPSLSQFVSS